MSLSVKVQALAIIPVRVGSQRLPGKALLKESGQELFLHTCDQAKKAQNIDLVCVATDNRLQRCARHPRRLARSRTNRLRVADRATAQWRITVQYTVR